MVNDVVLRIDKDLLREIIGWAKAGAREHLVYDIEGFCGDFEEVLDSVEIPDTHFLDVKKVDRYKEYCEASKAIRTHYDNRKKAEFYNSLRPTKIYSRLEYYNTWRMTQNSDGAMLFFSYRSSDDSNTWKHVKRIIAMLDEFNIPYSVTGMTSDLRYLECIYGMYNVRISVDYKHFEPALMYEVVKI